MGFSNRGLLMPLDTTATLVLSHVSLAFLPSHLGFVV